MIRSGSRRHQRLSRAVAKPPTGLRLEALEDRTLLDSSGPTLLHHPEAILRPDFGAQASVAPVQPVVLPPPGGSEGGGGRLGPIPVNVLVNDPNEDGTSINDTHSETSLVLGGNNTVVAAYNDSFYGNASPRQLTGYAVSADGGMSFTDQGRLPHTGIPQGDAGDPSLARDNVSGRIYLATLSFNGSILNVYYSDDNGATFSVPVNGDPGHGSASLDKEWLAVDNASGAGQGNVYLITRDFGGGNGIYLTRSTDQGLTFNTDWVRIASGSGGNVQGAWVTVGPDHTVYAFWYDATATPQTIRMRKSTDQGHTFAPAVTVATLRTTGINGDLSLGGFRSNAFPQAVVNPISNNIYVTFDDKGTGAERADVFFTQSTDGGATWSPEVKVNDNTTTTDAWQPAIAVTPTGNDVGIFWYDRRNDPSDNLIDRYGAIATVAGNTVVFGPNMRISDTSFPPAYGHDPAVVPTYMGDYDQVVASPSGFFLTWGDNRSPSRGHAGNRADVRFATVPVVVAGGAVLTSTPSGNTVGAVSSVRVTFDEPMDPTSATPDKIDSFTAPDGSAITVNAVTPVAGSNNTQFDIRFASQSQLGTYTLVLGPAILDQNGNPMDQNGDGIPGEIPGDEYTGTFTLQGPMILASTPSGTPSLPGVASLQVTFNQPMDPSTFGPGAVILTNPGGSIIPVVSVTPVAGSNNTQFTINPASPLGTTGYYTLSVGPNIQNPYGIAMDQDGDGVPGDDPNDVYTTTFGVRGPRIVTHYPSTQPDNLSFTQIKVTFSEPMDPTTFTPDKIASFTGPSGAIPIVGVVPVAGSNNTEFVVQLPPQTQDGAYTMVIGPDVRDPFGNQMDQDGDLMPGQVPSDQYTAHVLVYAPPAPVGPDGFGYVASATPAMNAGIVGRSGTFTIIDAADDVSVPVDLGAHTFSFYGVTYTGNNQLFVSSNGLISFGVADNAFTNTNLMTSPTEPVIAPLWADWIKFAGDPTGPMVVGKFTTFNGSPVLVIEWNQVEHFGYSGQLSFEAVLALDTGSSPGSFGFHYLDLQTGDIWSGGNNATVGSKAGGAQGPNRLLVNYQGRSPLVVTGRAILFATDTSPNSDALVTARVGPAVPCLTVSAIPAAVPGLRTPVPIVLAPVEQANACSPADAQLLALPPSGDEPLIRAAGLGDPLTLSGNDQRSTL